MKFNIHVDSVTATEVLILLFVCQRERRMFWARLHGSWVFNLSATE